MKKMLLFALPFMVMCFASCEKDNGNDENSVQKLVKSITYMESPDYPLVTTFEYDENGRVIRSEWIEEGFSMIIADITYKDNMIIETAPGYIKYQVKEEYIHYLNDDGYVIKTEYKDYWSDETYNTTTSQTYEYENGKVTKANGDGYSYEFQWQDNDMVKISLGNTVKSITYSTIDNKFNINILSQFDFQTGIGFDRSTKISMFGSATYSFKGTVSKHLPQIIDGEVYSYELDSDGYVTTIKVDGEPTYYIEYVE